MEHMISYGWNSVSVRASDVIALMERHRKDGVSILFHYADGLYRIGVDLKNPREPFYMDEETYPSLFAFAVQPVLRADSFCRIFRNRCMYWR